MIHMVLCIIAGLSPPIGPSLPYPPDTATWERYAVWGFGEESVVGTTVEGEFPGRIDGRVRMVTWPVSFPAAEGADCNVTEPLVPDSLGPLVMFTVPPNAFPAPPSRDMSPPYPSAVDKAEPANNEISPAFPAF